MKIQSGRMKREWGLAGIWAVTAGILLLFVMAPFAQAASVSPEDHGVDFTASKVKGVVPLTVGFTDLSTNRPKGWLWEFGDGSKSNLRNPVHTYYTAGVYTVNLTAGSCCSPCPFCAPATESKVAYITVIPRAPIADFTLKNSNKGYAGSTLFQFKDLSLNDPTSWSWTFGDGTTSIRPNPTHMYTKPGAYRVALIASNAGGSSSAVKDRYILVYK
ncbi:MAG: PKD domain-containing protein [Methanomicrobiales archaeon]|jgi:PKD repeat protein|nr:PKD domain-containing protein [Methanomicrobiales archaeon]